MFSRTSMKLEIPHSSAVPAQLQSDFLRALHYQCLKQYRAAGANLSASSTGAPISFRANHLKDNSIAGVQLLSVDREVKPAATTK
jgi:hypothetical protein